MNQTAAELESLGSTQTSIPPASLRASLGEEIRIQQLLESILGQLMENTSAARNWSRKLDERFEFLHEKVNFTKPDGDTVVGMFRGVDESGQIVIEVDGQRHAFASGRCSPIA